MLPSWREDGCLVPAVAEDGHFAILTDLQSDAILRREQGCASSCTFGGRSHSSRFEDATDSSDDAVSVNYDSTIKCRSIAHQLWSETAQWAAQLLAKGASPFPPTISHLLIWRWSTFLKSGVHNAAQPAETDTSKNHPTQEQPMNVVRN